MATGKTNASTGGGNQSLKEITFDEACSICQSWESGSRDIPMMLIFIENSDIVGGGFFLHFGPNVDYVYIDGNGIGPFTVRSSTDQFITYLAGAAPIGFEINFTSFNDASQPNIIVYFTGDTVSESFSPGWSARYFTVDKGVLNSGN